MAYGGWRSWRVGAEIMAHSEICPVCSGKGNLNAVMCVPLVICHGCNGRGWVTVGTEYPVVNTCTCHLKGKTTADMPCPAHG